MAAIHLIKMQQAEDLVLAETENPSVELTVYPQTCMVRGIHKLVIFGLAVPSSPLLKYRFLTENFSLHNFQPLPQDQFPYLI